MSEQPEKKVPTKEEMHKYYAIEFFNQSWDFLDKYVASKEIEDGETALRLAYASAQHWSYVGTTLNTQRGEWMISHVAAVLKRPEQALHHAKRCYDLTMEHHFTDFDLGYAYEGMARAYAAAGNRDEALKWRELALHSVEQIKEQGDRDQFLSDMNNDLWFDIK
ncbi:MAG: hypothetical protein OEM52_00555 [bacterium]|nr:hypothetical protein [bacterium]